MSDRHPSSNNPPPTDGAHSQLSDDWVAIGEVVGAFGVHGELKVRPLTDFPARFERMATIFLGDEHTPYDVEGAHLHKQQVLLHLKGIADPEAAARLRGSRLWIPASELTPLPADQFYLHDVIGLRVQHVNGQELGTVTDVMTTGANDVLVVRTGQGGDEVLLPVVKAFIKRVDLEHGVILVDPIPGLFDDAFDEIR